MNNNTTATANNFAIWNYTTKAYWQGYHKGFPSWTSNADEALKFANEEEAHNAIQPLEDYHGDWLQVQNLQPKPYVLWSALHKEFYYVNEHSTVRWTEDRHEAMRYATVEEAVTAMNEIDDDFGTCLFLKIRTYIDFQ